MRICGWQTRRRQQEHTQAEWREIAYREYKRMRERGFPVPTAMSATLKSKWQWEVSDRAAAVILFEARFQQDMQAERMRLDAIEKAAHARAEARRQQIAQGHLFAEAV